MSGSPFHQRTFRAMGSQISIILDHDDDAVAATRLMDAEAYFRAAEARLSRFRETSDLSRLNAATGDWVAVGQLLWQVLSRALALADETEGRFDPTLLNAILASGYRESYSEAWRNGKSDSVDTPTAPLHGRWRDVALDPSRRAVRLPAGVRVDLGGIAKGFTAERVVEWLSAWGAALVDAGGDVTVGDPPRGHAGWPVTIAPPEGLSVQDGPLTIAVSNATLATSGTDYRWWQQGGERCSHLLDPRTGRPAQSDIVTATLVAADACRAEAWATAALVAGLSEARPLLDAQGLDAALYDHAGTLHLTPRLQAQVTAAAAQ